jgi:acetyl-CoA carboxylase carboxyltransferase component
MPRSRRWTDLAGDESGSASLEFITTGLILLVPLVYLVLTMAQLQGGAMAVEGASRQAARVFVESPTAEEAVLRAERAVEFALADYGLDAADVEVTVECSPDPARCLTRRGYVTITVASVVALPLVPTVLDLDDRATVALHSSATQQVSRFWSADR